MRKTIVFLLCLSMVSAFAACGNTASPNDEDEITSTTEANETSERSEPQETDAAIQESAENGTTEGVSEFNFDTKTVTLNNGIEMPILGIGTFKLSVQEAENSVYWALRDGYRLIDTAQMYRNEEGVGRGIQKAMDEGFVAREEIFVTTKIWISDYPNADAAVNRSLKSLGLDYIDLMILHFSHPADDVDAYHALEGAVQALKSVLDADVRLQVRLHGAADVTELALERLLPRVHDHVPFQVRADFELGATEPALEGGVPWQREGAFPLEQAGNTELPPNMRSECLVAGSWVFKTPVPCHLLPPPLANTVLTHSNPMSEYYPHFNRWGN